MNDSKSYIYYDQYTVRVKTEVDLKNNKVFIHETMFTKDRLKKGEYDLIKRYFNESKEELKECFKFFSYPVPGELVRVFEKHILDFYSSLKKMCSNGEISFEIFQKIMIFISVAIMIC